MSYLYFEYIESESGKTKLYLIKNNVNDLLGRLEKIRVGAWMSWVLFLNQDCYMSASCLDEVREKIRELNGSKK